MTKITPKRIYIAGPMTGHLNYNREKFNRVAEKLKGTGHIILNPAILPDGLTEAEYMDICMAMLRATNIVYVLSGWENSPGANVERAYALKVGIEIQYE